ncbi:NAD(P)-dependent oxidoreductase [Nonomuraea cavernae]|uniref:NmrA family transcriptional regulator n=1 Tax=Nonomuraea cavernae TaxID=2045107 RepID=A0A917YUH4_9ACTN|nr:NAD(P)-binding oxidoreductase [Nonomuraea cavernae]MCA2185468.1 SDR family oxidoreductase [Nonomuraea cavernae]GGO66566.1 NmrA family transcriptional regulator [Nonomuraea cavernae]
MRIVVFGSTGRTGRLVVSRAARLEHQVVAFTRGTPPPDGASRVVIGDPHDPRAVREAVAGADAVISTLPGGDRRAPRFVADATRTIVTAMSDLGVRRVVVTSAYPIVADRPRPAVGLLRLLLATPYADVAAMERIVSSSDLDWTILRLNRLTDGPATGEPQVTRELFARPRALSRADAAALLLQAVQTPDLIRTAVNISG